MRDALVDLLDKVDRALAESRDVLSESDLDPVARTAAAARLRLSYPQSVLVVALAGGTGSGKSSLLNAVADEEVALTGGIRPMTTRPLALVPAGEEESLRGLLDDLGIVERASYDRLPGVCLVDLPDNDSVELDHRQQVEAILPRVDMVVWVTDPEKYRDASLHQAHISPMAGHQRQFLFVLNQIDRLPPEGVTAIVADLEEALREDGIDEPEVIHLAVQPNAGPPIGLDALLGRLDEARSQREAVTRKVLTDLADSASRLVSSSGGAHGVDFEARWTEAVDRAVELGLDGSIADGGLYLADFVRGLASEVGGETGIRLRQLADEVPSRFLGCVAGAPAAHAPPDRRSRSWLRRPRGRPGSAGGEREASELLGAEVDRVIGSPIRRLLQRRGRAFAAIAELSLAVSELERKTP